MTLHDLSQLYYLTREIEMDRRRLEELEQQALPGAQRLSGMPGGGGTCGNSFGPNRSSAFWNGGGLRGTLPASGTA